VGAPAIGAAIVGRPLGVKTLTGTEPITTAAGPTDVSVSERVVRHRPGRVHLRAGAGPPLGDINVGMEIDEIIIDGNETFCVV